MQRCRNTTVTTTIFHTTRYTSCTITIDITIITMSVGLLRKYGVLVLDGSRPVSRHENHRRNDSPYDNFYVHPRTTNCSCTTVPVQMSFDKVALNGDTTTFVVIRNVRVTIFHSRRCTIIVSVTKLCARIIKRVGVSRNLSHGMIALDVIGSAVATRTTGITIFHTISYTTVSTIIVKSAGLLLYNLSHDAVVLDDSTELFYDYRCNSAYDSSYDKSLLPRPL